MILSRSVATVLLAVGALAAGGCSDDDSAGSADPANDDATGERAYIVATTSIWADVASSVVCDGSFEVRTLVPAGGDAHAYEPSLRDRETLDGAALIVANGGGLEELLDDTLDAVADAGVPIVRMAELTDEGGSADPHVWFDPTRVRAALPALGEAFVAAGAEPAAVDACVADATGELDALDTEIAEILAPIPEERRLLVTNHDALGPFAERYGFEILGTVLASSSTLTEPSAGDLEALADAIEESGTPVVFTETLHGSDDAEALAQRLGIDVVELHTDSLGAPGSGAETYPDLLRSTARAIAAALGT